MSRRSDRGLAIRKNNGNNEITLYGGAWCINCSAILIPWSRCIKSASKNNIYNVVKNYFNCGRIVVANGCARCYNTYCISGLKKV